MDTSWSTNPQPPQPEVEQPEPLKIDETLEEIAPEPLEPVDPAEHIETFESTPLDSFGSTAVTAPEPALDVEQPIAEKAPELPEPAESKWKYVRATTNMQGLKRKQTAWVDSSDPTIAGLIEAGWIRPEDPPPGEGPPLG